MPSAAQRARKAAAKAAQRKTVVAQKKRIEQQATSLPGRIAVAAPCPVERCARSAEMFDAGIGYVILAKRLPSNVIACAIFLVDVYCLGVKDAFYRDCAPSDFAEILETLGGAEGLVDIAPPSARKLLHDAVAYTAEFNVPPAKDYAVIEKMFADVDVSQSQEVFTFGLNGKPFFVQGPRDRPDRLRHIVRALTARFGIEGWDFLAPADSPLGDRSSGVYGDDDVLSQDLDLDGFDAEDIDALNDVEFRRIEAEPATGEDK